MVSWSKALNASLKIIGYSIIWWIVGGIIMIIGFSMIGNQMNLPNVLMSGKAPNFASILAGIIIVAIYIIAIIGSLAAFMKVFTELNVEEVSKHLRVLKKFDAV